MNDWTSGNWKLIIFLSSILPFLILMGSHFILLESPRYLMSIGKIEKGIEVLD